jgi:D-alanyl-D-alanine dipeptidase
MKRSQFANFMGVLVGCTVLARSNECKQLVHSSASLIFDRHFEQTMTQKFHDPCRIFIGVGLLLLLPVYALTQDLPYRLLVPGNELARCEQMILVLVPSWKSAGGMIQLFERSRTGGWITARPGFACVVGKNGLGWGIGLHGTGIFGEPRKKEGDGRAPAGIFRLNSCVGIVSSREAGLIRIPYRQATATTVAVYDPRSRYYNRVVDRNLVKRADWSGAEQMLRPDGLYQWVVVVEHNWKPYSNYGSCIFLHLWLGKGIPTIGCTAMSLADLKFVVYWLDAKKNPLLVQLPEPVYLRLKLRWRLPQAE